MKTKKRRDPNIYPPGLNAKKVAAIIRYYDEKQAEDLIDDPDHQFVGVPSAWLEVPLALVPRVRAIVQKYRKSA